MKIAVTYLPAIERKPADRCVYARTVGLDDDTFNDKPQKKLQLNQCAVGSRCDRFIIFYWRLILIKYTYSLWLVKFRNQNNWPVISLIALIAICWCLSDLRRHGTKTSDRCWRFGSNFGILHDRRGWSTEKSNLPKARWFRVSRVDPVERRKWEKMWIRCKLRR